MATLLQEILTNNHEFLANNKYTKEISKYPQKKFALLTCMDTRLVELINKALGIHRGDAKIIQNAGTSLIGEMGETVKSLLLTIGLILTPTPPKMYLQSLKNLRQILLFPMIYLSTDLSLTPIRVNLIFWQMAIKRFKTNRAPCFLASSNF